MRRWRSLLCAASLSLLCAAAIVGCGSSKSSSSTSTSSSAAGSSSTSSSSGGAAASGADTKVVALVPSSIKSKGTLTVAADASYAPDEFFAPDGHTVIGMDADLATALAAKMGMKAKVENAVFETIIPGLASGKYDIGASSFTDTKEREKTVDFVTYANVGESFFTKASGGTDISSIADICGKTVAVEKGTTEQDDATKQGAKCKTQGKPGVTVLTFQDQNGANLALQSGRAQLVFADSPPAAYAVKKSNGQFKLVGSEYAAAPYGLAMAKGNGLDKAVLVALKDLMKDGTYQSIFKKWGLPQEAMISNPKINGAIS
jgi:polar amino acid transport system substrate-binding protein